MSRMSDKSQPARDVQTLAEGPLWIVTISRPERRNAINNSVAEGLARAMDELDGRSDLRVGIITGAGGHFSSGMDLGAFVSAEGPRLCRDSRATSQKAVGRCSGGLRARRRIGDRAGLRSSGGVKKCSSRNSGSAERPRGDRRRLDATADPTATSLGDGARANRPYDECRGGLSCRSFESLSRGRIGARRRARACARDRCQRAFGCCGKQTGPARILDLERTRDVRTPETACGACDQFRGRIGRGSGVCGEALAALVRPVREFALRS
jgi:Enoyl-CoA hydratase/isomerase